MTTRDMLRRKAEVSAAQLPKCVVGNDKLQKDLRRHFADIAAKLAR